MVIFSDFFCFDYLLYLLNIYTLEYAHGTSFDLLIMYFQLFGCCRISSSYLFQAADLYRLSPPKIFQLIYNNNTDAFSKYKLKKCVREQLRTSYYDLDPWLLSPCVKGQFKGRCAFCEILCPRSNTLYKVACCYSRVHFECKDEIKRGRFCTYCGKEFHHMDLRKYSKVNYGFNYLLPGEFLDKDVFLNKHPS